MTPFLIKEYGASLRSTLIEVEVTSASATTFKLPDSEILREKRIVGLEIPDNTADGATSPSERPLVSNVVIRNAWLTLKKLSNDVIEQHPLQSFLVNPAGTKEIRLLDFCNFNPQKSEIVLGATTGLSAGESFALVFYYVAAPGE